MRLTPEHTSELGRRRTLDEEEDSQVTSCHRDDDNDDDDDEKFHADDVTVRTEVHNNVSEEHVESERNGKQGENGNEVDKNDEEEKEEGEVSEEDDDGLPIDRGWAWVVAVAAHFNALIMVGYTRSMGILFLEFLRVFQTSVTKTAMITGVMAGSYGVSVFLVMQVLMGRFKERNLVITGVLISTAAIIVSVFARNVLELILSQGIFVGLGHSLIYGPAIVLIGKYFKKKRSLATSIGNSGISSGAVVFPQLTRYLLKGFGLRGALLIIGGVNFHMLVFALLLRPIESFRRKRKPKDDVELQLLPKTPKEIPASTENNTDVSKNITESSQYPKNEITGSVESLSKKYPSLSAPLQRNIRPRTKSECSRISDYHSQSDVFSFIGQSEIVEKKRVSVFKKLKIFCSGLGFELWKNPIFLTLAFCNVFAIFLVLFLTYYPAVVVDQGGTEEDGATFLSVAGAIDFFARLSAGYFADLGYMKRTHICAITLAIAAILCQMVRFFTTFWLQLMAVILYGLFGGIFNSFIPVLLADFLGMKNLSKSLGFLMIQHGVAIGVYHPIVGALRDSTGSYWASFHCMGAATGLASISLLFEPVARKFVKKEEKKEVCEHL